MMRSYWLRWLFVGVCAEWILLIMLLSGCAAFGWGKRIDPNNLDMVPVAVHQYAAGGIDRHGPWRGRALVVLEVENLADRLGVGVVRCASLDVGDLSVELEPLGRREMTVEFWLPTRYGVPAVPQCYAVMP